MFFIQTALHDRHASVLTELMSAGMSLIEARGSAHLPDLLPIFEGFLSSSSSSREDSVRQATVVFLGALARHLDKSDAKIPTITDTLVQALATPSEPVQSAVAKCLPPLVAATKSRGEDYSMLCVSLSFSICGCSCVCLFFCVFTP